MKKTAVRLPAAVIVLCISFGAFADRYYAAFRCLHGFAEEGHTVKS